MSDWTKRDQARVDFLNAAVAKQRALDKNPPGGAMQEVMQAESLAWRKYRDLIDGKEENLPLNEKRWYCPHCGSERPPFQFQLIGEALIGIGAIQYFNIACGNESCRRLLAVVLAGFIPDAMMVEEARRQMAAQKHKA